MNLVRMDCIAAVNFLDALHIDNYPVFGLVTNGKRGRLIVVRKQLEPEDEYDEYDEDAPYVPEPDPRIAERFGLVTATKVNLLWLCQ